MDHVQKITYMDVVKMRRFLTDWAKIEPRRKTGTCTKHQRLLSRALKRARALALLPMTTEHALITGWTGPRGLAPPRPAPPVVEEAEAPAGELEAASEPEATAEEVVVAEEAEAPAGELEAASEPEAAVEEVVVAEEAEAPTGELEAAAEPVPPPEPVEPGESAAPVEAVDTVEAASPTAEDESASKQ